MKTFTITVHDNIDNEEVDEFKMNFKSFEEAMRWCIDESWDVYTYLATS